MALGDQATTPTGTVQLTDIFNPVFINRVVRDVASEPIIGQQLVEVINLTGGDVNSYTYQSSIWEEMTGAAVVAENDAAPEDALETDSVQIDGNRVALSTFVADATEKTIVVAGTKALERLTKAVRRFFHEGIFDLFTSFTNAQGTNAVENDLANWDLVTHNFLIQNHGDGDLWVAFANDAWRDLRADLVANAAALFGAAFGDRAQQALQTRTVGQGVPWDGYTAYRSGDNPAGDTTGWTSALGVRGPDAAIEMPVWQELRAEMQRDATRFGTWIVVSMIAEPGIIKQDNARAFITRT
jgi:hypothetical protein